MKESVLLLNGMLDGISIFCRGVNFVPYYTAQYIECDSKGVIGSLEKHFGCTCTELYIDSDQGRALAHITESWIKAKMFGAYTQHSLELSAQLYSDCLDEIKDRIFSISPKWVGFITFRLCDPDTWGYGNECIGYINKGYVVALTFGCWD